MKNRPFRKVLVANRGEIACRIIRTLRKLGMASVAVYSDADVDSNHVQMADESILIGGAAVSESYLRSEEIIRVAQETGADAIHPGYGLLSENTGFARACTAAGIEFIGPSPEHIEAFSLKHTARRLAMDNGVPVLPGSPLLDNPSDAESIAVEIGFPLMIKSTAGGGGIGMSLCHDPDRLQSQLQEVAHLSQANFKDSGVYLERFVSRARHIEVQIFGDGRGKVLSLGLRDCSMQRRNQKVVEETPPPGLSSAISSAMSEAACRLTAAAGYRSAGTVEFLFDVDRQEFYFLEVNTRLQVEHGITEEVTGIDLVEWMIRLQSDEAFVLPGCAPTSSGHSIQARIYAEDPSRGFQPSVGTLSLVKHPGWARCDSWVFSGTEVSAHYDPLLTKVIVRAEDRPAAIELLLQALGECQFDGIETNLEYLRQVLASDVFTGAAMTTGFLRDFHYRPVAMEIRRAGTMTTVQDYPGRTGYWSVGIPPSGPMDSVSFQLANLLAGNAPDAAGLEMTSDGPTIFFHHPAVIALTGALMQATLDGSPVPHWQAFPVPAGSTLRMGRIDGYGMRCYMAVKGGIKVAPYLGSRSTFTLGQFGGHAGRALAAGDMVHIHPLEAGSDSSNSHSFQVSSPPVFSDTWELAVLYGPHGAPDFFTEEDIRCILETSWEVHYNSARTGIRLIGPKPQWARRDGGEAGLHPSNIHDNAYAVGAVDFTGDMPVILGVDGPSLGGFVCPFTIIQSDLWKLGQLRPGYRIRFVPVSDENARELNRRRHRDIQKGQFDVNLHQDIPAAFQLPSSSTVLRKMEGLELGEDVSVRRSGDSHVLIEFGKMELDLKYRLQAQLFYERLKTLDLEVITDMTPGIRSLQLQFDGSRISAADLVREVESAVRDIRLSDDIEVPSRVVHLPLSWNDPSIQKAIDIYQQSVRPGAPWWPSNIEFIRRINGLESEDAVRRLIFDASYIVMGLGDVYLGAPVAVPVDPRHRLVTTKYNPARTWTPENAVGIGGSYLCVYGMEGPGGYQLFGRTLQMWNRYRVTREFPEGHPWLLRFFDRIRFYPVSAGELMDIRRDFIHGLYPLRIEDGVFSWRAYQSFLRTERKSIDAFRMTQQAAFSEERERWAAAGHDISVDMDSSSSLIPETDVPEGCETVESVLSGNVWKILAAPGERCHPDNPLMIMEAMKMEVAVYPLEPGIIREILVREGQSVRNGQALAIMEPD